MQKYLSCIPPQAEYNNEYMHMLKVNVRFCYSALMQISDRLLASFGGINIRYRYMPKTHIDILSI